MKKALICGITGQDGSYLARLLLQKGYQVYGTSRDAQVSTFKNLMTLDICDKVNISSMILTDFRSVLQTVSTISPDEIYNLAGQSSVGLSFHQPVETLESITTGTLNLLEVIRFLDMPVRLYHAGSSECYGDTSGIKANEETPFRPRSPYAVAKAAAHWEVANYREAYGLFACTGILFNHESPLRPKRFVTQKIVATACEIARGNQQKLTLGNMSIYRDWGWAEEYVEAMWQMLQADHAEDFVISTGKAFSLEAFCASAFERLNLNWRDYVCVDERLYRPSEIMYGCGDSAKAQLKLGWSAKTFMPDVVFKMIDAEMAVSI